MIDNIKSLARKFLRFANQLKPHYFYSEISKIKRCDVLLFCHDVDRGLTLNGLAYSPLIDSIYEEFTRKKIKCQAISLPWSRLGLKNTVNGSLLFNRNYLVQLLKNKIFKTTSSDAYDFIFEKSQARFVIGIGLPSDLCVTAKKHNVTTAELLHGIGYRFVPWGWDQLTGDELPNKVLVLDDVSEETFKSLESKGLSVIKVPHPFYKKISDPKFVFPVEWSYGGKQGKKNIIVTLQWGYDGEVAELKGVLNNGIFYENLEELIRKRSDFFWHFRLHPVQMKRASFEKAISFVRDISDRYTNVVWQESSAAPLVSVASLCDAHITMSSMSCYDVAMLGVTSLVLCPTTRGDGYYNDYFAELVDDGYVIKHPFDLKFIENWIDSAKKKPSRSLVGGQYDWDQIVIKSVNDVKIFSA